MAEREEARAAKDFARADEIRDRAGGAGLGGAGLGRRAAQLVPKALMANQIIYGRQPVAEAERGRRRVHRVWRAPETDREELERLCGSPDHQGVVAEVDPYPYGDPRGLLRRRGRAAGRARPGAGPAQPRRGLPLGRVRRGGRGGRSRAPLGSGHRRHLQGLGGRGRAPRRSPTSATSPTGWPRRRRRASGSGAPTPRPSRRPGRSTSTARPCSSSAARAKASARGSPPPATGSSPCPSGGQVESLNVSAAAAALLFEALRQRGTA